MQKLRFTIYINAPREKVWNTMLDDATYREWSAAFMQGSYYKGDWEQGSKIFFVGPKRETGKEMGMVSRIAENRKHEYVSIEHLGIYSDGVEDTTSEEARKWAPAFENYSFTDKDDGTEVVVELDVPEEYAEDFQRMWPAALARLKELAE